MKNQGRLFSILLSLLMCLYSASAKADVADEFVAGEYVVKLKNQVGAMSMSSIKALPLGFNTKVKNILSDQSQMILVERPILERPEAVLNELRQNPNVEVVEPNYIYHASVKPNDSQLDRLWGLINKKKSSGGIDIDAEQAWNITQGSRDIVVAVIDTGVNHRDPDLVNNMWINEAEKNGQPGVDDDGNGYVDDVYGYDFANDDGDPLDDNDHGTHCAGTIGAEGDNGLGVVGVNWKVKIMALKFMAANGGGSLAAAVNAIDYATQMKAHVMNNSWGGGGRSKLLEEAIQRAEQAGILFVAAAGNNRSNNDARPSYPASYQLPNVISVAALDRMGKLANFSNYGNNTVHVGAPGVDILSTGKSGLVEMSGTSMAAPHVAGIAALMLAHDKSLSHQDLKTRILETSVRMAHLHTKMTHGIVNAYNAVTNNVPAPDPNDPVHWPTVAQSHSTEHPYPNSSDQSFTITVPGAEKVAVHFSHFETEKGYDFVYFYDDSGNEVGKMSGRRSGAFSPAVQGDTIVVRLVSDYSINRHGFDIDKVAYAGTPRSGWRSVADPVSTDHPYSNYMDQEVVFGRAGASEIRVQFGQFQTEKKYDFVYFYDGSGQEIGRWDGNHSGEKSPVAQGDKLILRLKTDYSVTDYGFDVESVEYR